MFLERILAGRTQKNQTTIATGGNCQSMIELTVSLNSVCLRQQSNWGKGLAGMASINATPFLNRSRWFGAEDAACGLFAESSAKSSAKSLRLGGFPQCLGTDEAF
jgi:hypothetical protein